MHNRWGWRDHVDRFREQRPNKRRILELGAGSDPDVVYAYAQVDEALLRRIDRELDAGDLHGAQHRGDETNLTPHHEVEALNLYRATCARQSRSNRAAETTSAG